ncbi:unnamed protein product [Prorocentrum cordatum]|uniref:EF-hand domain-containing protein n=1 Tax=Prorocentrum cordatum TaxID=2364126 RepID=A0ABN9TWY5_9DINO|nr:unnamed protein product [Polarella glacialis]
MDADSDGKLSKEEFVALGPLLDPPMSQGSMLPLFSEADADGDGFVSPEELPGPAAAGAEGDEADEASDDGPRLADRELAAYRRVPAIASGTAELVLTLRPDVKVPRPSELSKDVGEAFQAELGKQLGLDVNLASAESVGDGGTVRSVLLMWTADAEDGGAVQATLQSRATAIEKAVEERVTGLGAPWMRGGTAELWLGCSLDFYGPGAASLPRGSKLVRKLGVQKDRQAAHSLDARAGGGAEARP